MKIYIPPQIKHLLVSFTIFVAIFLLARRAMVPDSYGEYGHYRGNSLGENAIKGVKYAGHEACFECHQDVADMKEMDLHDVISCESCHGPGFKHVQEPELVDMTLNKERAFCGLCHALNFSKPADVIFQIDLKEHYIDKNCIDCHNPHSPWELNEENLPEGNF